MASSINIVHEMINKVGFEFDDATAKRVSNLAKKAGQMAASGMASEASVGFEKIGEIFNKELAKLGKQKVDFSKMISMPDGSTFESMLNTFVSQVTGGLIKSINTGMSEVEKQFGTLITRRTQAVQQRDSLEKQYRIKNTEAEKLDDAYAKVSDTMYGKKTLPIDDKFVANAQDAVVAFMDMQDKLENLNEKGKINASTLQTWLSSANELAKVYATISNMSPAQQNQIGAQLGKPNMKYLLNGGFENHIDFGGDVIEKFVDNNDVYNSLTKAQEKVAELDSQITQLTSKHPELIDKQKAIEAEELINRVQGAYERLFNTQGKNKGQINARNLKDIESALNYVPKSKGVAQITKDMDATQASKIKAQATKAFETLDVLGNKYSESVGKNWEQQAQAAIKFAREYEAQMKNPQINKEMVKGWADTYKEVKPMIAEYEAMLQNVVNMANGKELTNIGKTGTAIKDATASAEQKRIADEASAEANAKARVEAEAKAKANQEAAAMAEKEKIAKEGVALAERQSLENTKMNLSLKEHMISANKQQVEATKSGTNIKESMRLIGSDGVMSAVQGQDLMVDAKTMVGQLINNLKNGIVMSLHDHPNAINAFTPDDINTFAKLYYGQGAKINGVIANGIIQTIDFTGISQDVAIKIGQSFSDNLSKVAKQTGMFTYKDKNIVPNETIQGWATSDPKKYAQAISSINDVVNSSLNEAFKQNGVESTLNAFNMDRLPELTQYLLDIQKSGQNAITPIEKLKNLLISLKPNQTFDWGNYANILSQFNKGSLGGSEAVKQILTQINAETQAQEKLNQTKLQQQQIEQSDNDGVEVAEENAKTEAIKQQNGALQENVNLKTQASGQSGVVTGTGTTPSKVTPTQTVPSGIASTEVTDLEAVKAKVLEVTNAVNTKTQAFTNEEVEVKRVAQSEVQALSEVENKITSVIAAIGNIHTQSSTLRTPEVNTEAFKQEGQVAEGAISQEMGSLQKLRVALQLTTKRINEKTQAFEAEKGVVNNVVNSEVNALTRLNTQVDTVNQTVMTLLQNIQNVQTGASNIVVPQVQPAPQNNTGVQGQGFGGGGKGSSQLFNAKIDTQFSSLSLMYAQLESVGKLTPQIEQQWLQLWDSLSKVNDNNSLALWRQELTQVKNSMQEIMIANNLVEQEGIQSFKSLIDMTKLYNEMAIKAANAKTPEERSYYTQEANAALIEQQRILQGITLTKKQQAEFDKLESKRVRELGAIQSKQVGAENAKQQKQEEAIIVRELIDLYEQLGRARAQGDFTTAGTIRGQIKAERGKLSSVDRATDDKFAQATARGEQSVVDEANKAATKAQNEALRERQKILGDLIRIHRELGVLEEKEKSSTVNDAKKQQYKAEIYELYRQISAKEKLILLTQEEISLLNQTHSNAGRSARISNAGEREAEINKLKGQYAKLGEAQAKAEHKGTNEAKERFAVLAKEIAEKKTSLQLTQQELDMLRKIVAESYKKQSGILLKGQQDAEFQQQIKNAQREAGLSKSKSAESRAIDTFAQASALPGITPEVQNSLNEYQSKIQSLHSLINSFPSDRVATDAERNRLIQSRLEVDAYTKKIQELVAQQERLSGSNAQATGINMSSVLGTSPENMEAALTKQIQTLTKGRAHIKSYNAETQQLVYTQKAAGGGTTQFTAEINRLNGQLTLVQGTTTKTMGVFDTIGAKIKQFSYYFTGSMMIYRVIGWVRQGVTAVKELDHAMTELKKVTDETEETYDKFLDTASEIGSRVGSTMKDVVSSTADWARLGYTMKEAAQFAESTQVLMNVSEFTDVSKATDSLISSIQAFKYTAEESMSVVDILNEIGKSNCRGYIVICNRVDNYNG